MSPTSHAVSRLRKLYGIVWSRMRFLNERAMHPFVGHVRPMSSCLLEQLEPRVLLSGTPSISQMIVFGDSLSDTGNVPAWAAWAKGFTESNGRFTSDSTSSPPSAATGVWHEELASQLGIPAATAASVGGQNWATGGAETGGGYESGTAWFGGILNYPYGFPNVGQQISDYFGQAMVFPSNTLYAIWAGGNDLMELADVDPTGLVAPHAFDMPAVFAVENIEGYIQEVITDGARYILWPNLPELEQVPHASGFSPSVANALEDAVSTFNTYWASAIAGLRSDNPGVRIYGLDVHSLFNEMHDGTYPGYAFSNVEDEASKADPVPDDADTYLFWDGMHPTQKAHKLLGEAAYALVASSPSVDTIEATLAGGTSVQIEWTVSDANGPGLKQVELWRAPDAGGVHGDWGSVPAQPPVTVSGTGQVEGSFIDNPPEGVWWYGIHVVDENGVCSTEEDSGLEPQSVTVIVPANQPPSIGSLADSPDPLALGSNLTLTASNVTDSDGSVATVDFYRDVNWNGSIDVGTDLLLGTGTQSGTTWTWTGSTSGFPLGTNTYMAIAEDDESAWSSTVTTTGTVYPAGAYVVNSLADTVAVDGVVTLREAIQASNTNLAAGDALAGSATATDVIVFSSSLFGQTIHLTAGELPISDDLTIVGPGAGQLTIDAGGLSRIFNVTATAAKSVAISGLTLSGGSTSNGGGAFYNSSGTVTLSALTITNNSASSGGGVASAGGVLTISNSTIYKNSATGSGSGGGLTVSGGQVVIDQSTISNNAATSGNGGGIYSTTTGSLTIRQSTVAINKANQGGGIYAQNALPVLSNTLVAQNQATLSGPDVYGSFSTSSSYNLIGVIDSTSTGLTADPHTQTGTAAVPLDPMLGLLAGNSGPTLTHSLLTSSPAIDAGNNALALDASGNQLTTDQRGQPRISGAAVDIGATEGSLAPGLTLTGPTSPTLDIGQRTTFTWDPRTIPVNGLIQLYLDPDGTVNGNELYADVNVPAVASNGQDSWAPTLDPAGQYTVGGSVTDPLTGQTWSNRMAGTIQLTYLNVTTVNSTSDVVASDGLTTLREAILNSNSNPRSGGGLNVIMFDPSLAGQTITLSGFDLVITANVDILGLGQTLLTVDGNNQTDVFNVSAGALAVFSDLTVSHGANGGIVNAGTTKLQRVTVTSSHDLNGKGGGGVYNSGTLTVDSSIVSGNSAGGSGGGICNTGTLVVDSSIVSGNSAGGDWSNGGGIYNSGTLTVTNTTIENNTITGWVGRGAVNGGGIYSSGGASQLTVSNCTISGNSASNCGGGFFGGGTLNGCVISGNTAYNGGGGIYSSAPLTVSNSTIYGNAALGSSGYGGGINLSNNSASLGLYQVTISGNHAAADGGGLYVNTNQAVNIYQSTIAENQSSGNGGGVANNNAGTNVAVFNTIIAGNTATGVGQDAKGTFSTTSSHNLVGIVDGSIGLGNTPFSLVGTLTAPLDARLNPIGMNGGAVPTLTLQSLSPAVDAGANSLAISPDGSPLVYDERGVGYDRYLGDRVDIGAVEYLASAADNQAPTIGSLSVSSAVVKQGQTITLTANNVADDHGVASVSFYIDSNHNGVGDPTELLGTSTNGWTWTGTVTWGTGIQTYLAQATDDGYPAGGPQTSAWASVLSTVTAPTPPQITLGTYYLKANQANQQIPVYVTGLDQVTGFNLDAQIVGASTPKFQSINFTGGIWDGHTTIVAGGPVSGSTQYAQASVIFSNPGDQVQANGLLCTLVIDTTGYVSGQSYTLKLADTDIGVDSSFLLYGGAADPITVNAGTIQLSQATIAGRYIVYNNSAWDGNNPAVNAADSSAIATDKQALLPTQAASFANYTSYSKGINEIMIDVASLLTTPTLADFSFKVGNTIAPSTWSVAPTPTSLTVLSGQGTGGSDRIVVTWSDGAIRGKWLQVDVGAATLGLAQDDVFYFGNAPGECGNSSTSAFVDGSDMAGVRDHPADFLHKATITNTYDYNRDRFVDGTDMAIARDNATNFLTALKLITVPVAAPLVMAGGELASMSADSSVAPPVAETEAALPAVAVAMAAASEETVPMAAAVDLSPLAGSASEELPAVLGGELVTCLSLELPPPARNIEANMAISTLEELV